MTVSAPGLTQRTTALQSLAGADRRSRIKATLRRNPRLFIGGSLVALLLFVAVFAPLLDAV